MGASDPGASSISVTVRVRPFTINEAAQITKRDEGMLFLGDGSLAGAPTPKLGQKGIRPVVKVIDDKCLVFDPPEDNPVTRFSRSVVSNMGKRVKDQTFAFDRVFDENTTQAEVYEATARELLDSVLDGYNATVFAYGATGCGKTHTITGTAQQPGIIFLTMQELFEKIAERSDEKQTDVSLSYLEIYNETIRDLLVPGGSKQGLMLREDANQAVSVAGLSSHHPRDVQQVMDMIVTGNEFRTVSPTAANATSSRSHAVLQINVAQKDRNADVSEPHTMATLSIIDLAGSERASATKNRGDRLLEGANINKSLLALGSCINALCDPRKKNHVPYRNSKLTRLLKFSLGGNCKTVMIVCVSPSSAHFDETQNTLRYANRAKNIQTKVTRNVFNVNRHVKDFLVKIDEQMAMINDLKAQQKDLETVAFTKFKKQCEKREGIMREGITRIRAAYDHSSSERAEKINNSKRLRQIERRICLLSAWVGAFEDVCASREDGMAPNIDLMRKTVAGILVELESSRHHYRQLIEKTNWERAVDSACQNSIRLLNDVDGSSEGLEVSNLNREAALLKAYAERDAHAELFEMEKDSDKYEIQSLLTAQIEIISSLDDILNMSEEQAISHAKSLLSRLLESCTLTISNLIKPDGSIKIGQAVQPSRRGTPKRKKNMRLSHNNTVPIPIMQALAAVAPQVYLSPIKPSPRRKKPVFGKKNIHFSPKKKPSSKRTVRWRDDTESGILAEFEKTPHKLVPTPEQSMTDDSIALPLLPTSTSIDNPNTSNQTLSSSPLPATPVPSLDLKTKSRFKAGFLTKSFHESPPMPISTNTSILSSDIETSPLRDINTHNVNNLSTTINLPRSLLHRAPNDIGNSSGSETENSIYQLDRKESAKIGMTLKRSGSLSRTHSSGGHEFNRTTRRKSPTAASFNSSPINNENALFTASHARRMVPSQKDSVPHATVLSPRAAPVTKHNRRITSDSGRQATSSLGNSTGGSGGIRISSGNSSIASTGPKLRASIMGDKTLNGWR
ncbi:Kinesin-like protein 6 [Erysiphe neolycopersici]|uniref:Kinesin-like protein 6 n=1 Tax=Erysiphe neolycopersici TaxID=212602 RepID=A0A420I027_9PEZI|nr:Kinesin-like protein 6 [Erysiphe neolycopersici]